MRRRQLHEQVPGWGGHAEKEKAKRKWERKRLKKARKKNR
jgi:hypothetical protein